MTQIAIAIYAVIYIIIIFFALRDIKRMVIIWMPMQLLFNDMVALKFSPPVLTLSIAVNFTLPVFFFCNYFFKRGFRKGLNHRGFFLKPVLWAYLFSYVASLIFTIAPFASVLNPTLKLIVRSWMMVFIFFKCINTKDDIILFIKASAIIGAMWGGLGLLEVVLKDNPIQDFIYLSSPDAFSDTNKDRVYYNPPFLENGVDMRLGMVRAYSFFGIHIQFGCACLTYLFFLIALYMQNIFNKSNKWFLLSLVLIASGVFTCNSKTPLLGLFICAPAFIDFRQTKTIKYLLLGCVAIVLVLIFVPQYWESIMSLFDPDKAQEAGGSTVELRKEQVDVAIRLFEMNPIFGNGVGSLALMSKTGASEGLLGAEGWYLSIPPERGVVGVLVYFFQYIYIYKKTSRIIPQRIIFFFLVSIFSMELFTGLLDMVIYMPIIIVLYRYFYLKKFERLSV